MKKRISRDYEISLNDFDKMIDTIKLIKSQIPPDIDFQIDFDYGRYNSETKCDNIIFNVSYDMDMTEEEIKKEKTAKIAMLKRSTESCLSIIEHNNVRIKELEES